ncbi:peptidylprolyl isomerase [soil metagenome]
MHIRSGIIFLAILALISIPTFGQETEERVVDEVVAQVNDGVITLSRVKREKKSIVDAAVEQGKARDVAEKEVNEKEGELIANLINEELLLQRAKEIGLEREVDAAVNQQFLQIMKENNLTTLEALYAEMRKSGVNPDDIRELWRKQRTREYVIQQEVQRKEYWKPTATELKAYYEANKARFATPETVTLSEIFLGFAGRTEEAVRSKGLDLVKQLRAGGDFAKAVAENSDRPNAAETKGKVGKIKVADLEPTIAAAIKNIRPGGYSDPIELDDTGFSIVFVEAREAASSDSKFDEEAVRLAILQERSPAATKKFISSLRSESYIKINERYRPLVSPILFEEERKEHASSN